MADVKWIKLSVTLPDNKKIKQIRRLPDGDTVALMWVFLMCLAGEVNDDGMVYFTPEIPFTDEMLAEQFSMDINTVRLALKTFQHFGMIEIIDDIIHLDSWEKWQSTESLSKIREQNRVRVARHREKKKLAAGNVTCNVTETPCNAIEEDKEREEDKEKEKKNNASASFLESVSQIVSFLNEQTGKSYKAASKKTRTLIHARMNEGFTVEDFKTVIAKKCADWLNDDKMDRYLRPETLFGTKFEDYLNEKPKGGGPNGGNGKHGRRDAAANGKNPEGHDYGVVF